MSGSKKRVPRPVRSPLVTLAKSTPVGIDEAAEIMMPFDAMIDALRRGWLTDDSVGSMGSYLGRMQRYLCASYALAKSAGNAQMLERAKAGLTALCQAIQRRIDAGQMDRPVICTGDELRAIQSAANMLAAALPHASCGAWALAAESAADSERKILILMGRGLHAS